MNIEVCLPYAQLFLYRLFRMAPWSSKKGQDFAEYALILGAIGVVATAVLIRYRTELIAAFNSGIAALAASH